MRALPIKLWLWIRNHFNDHARRNGVRKLKAKGRSSRDAQVVVGAVVEVNLVARFGANSQPTNEALNATAGIEGEVCSRSTYAVNRTGKGAAGDDAGIIGAEVNEPQLAGDEGAERTAGAELQLGPEEAGEGADA